MYLLLAHISLVRWISLHKLSLLTIRRACTWWSNCTEDQLEMDISIQCSYSCHGSSRLRSRLADTFQRTNSKARPDFCPNRYPWGAPFTSCFCFTCLRPSRSWSIAIQLEQFDYYHRSINIWNFLGRFYCLDFLAQLQDKITREAHIPHFRRIATANWASSFVCSSLM